MVLLIAHVGFILWFYAGYKYGKLKCKLDSYEQPRNKK